MFFASESASASEREERERESESESLGLGLGLGAKTLAEGHKHHAKWQLARKFKRDCKGFLLVILC